MKRVLHLVVFSVTLLFASCHDPFDDSLIWDKLNNHENRISTLEELCKQMNTNIGALQTIVTALQNNDYVTSVIPIQKDGTVIGYTITFTKSQPITIYHGTDGKNGANGADGKDGKDGYTPQIGVAQHIDGIYYWTIDGDWLLDDAGNKIKAVGTDGQNGTNGSDGEDGQNGSNGKDGKDGNTPRLKIENGYWYVSYDNGSSWERLCKATGEDGEDGKDGTNGSNGSDGKDGEDGITPLLKIENEYWYVSYDNGATWKQLGKAVGEDGSNGSNGANGTNGKDGKDGITPRLKIENDYWYVSYDNGSTWTKLGKAKGDDGQDGANGQNGTNGQNGDSMFKSVTQDEDNVYFTLSDGTVIALPKCNKADVEKLLARIQSISYIPTHSDGKASMSRVFGVDNGCAVFDYQISPKDAVKEIAANWASIISMKGVNTQTRAVSFIEMPILSFEAEESTGIISVTISGENLSYEFYKGMQDASVALCISDGNNILTSDFIPMIARDKNRRIWYKSVDEAVISPYNKDVFGANIISNIYEDGYGIITFDKDVTKIGSMAFADCSQLTSISIPSSATTFESAAFVLCGRLEKFESEYATEDGKCIIIDGVLAAFAPAFMQSYDIPDGVKIIGTGAFIASQLKKVNIPDSVTTIEYSAFQSSSLSTIFIPGSVTSIGHNAFSSCNSLSVVYCDATIPPYGDSDMFKDTSSPLTIYVPSASVDMYKSASYWSEYADSIYGCALNSSTTIKYTTVDGNIADAPLPIISNTYNNGVGEIVFYSDGKNIPAGAFNDCSNLKTLVIPDGITTIGSTAFASCYLLEEITIPESVVEIGDTAFSYCQSIQNISLPNNLKTIGANAFSYCYGLKSIAIPNSTTVIGNSAFDNCLDMTEVIIGNGVKIVGDYAFRACTKISSLTIGNSVESIGRNAFSGSMTSITIPNSVTTLGTAPFAGCNKLQRFYGKFVSQDGKCLIVNNTLNSVILGDATSFDVPYGITTIGDELFKNCSDLVNISIPNTVTSIGKNAFYYCYNLTDMTIPDSVTTIGDDAFNHCAQIKEIIIPNSVRTIGARAFFYCDNLTDVTIGTNVASIGDRAFFNCRILANVYCKAATPPAIYSRTFGSNASDFKIYIPTNSYNIYKSSEYWSTLTINKYDY